MKYIDIQGSKLRAIVDDEDFDEVSKIKWHLSTNYYAVCTTHDYVGGVRKTYHPSMHRMIMKAKKGDVVDHLNRHTLDNRRGNLRVVTSGDNTFNGSMRSDNTSGFRGVRRKRNEWAAEIGHEGKMIYLGAFKTVEQAVKARKDAELRYYPHYANSASS